MSTYFDAYIRTFVLSEEVRKKCPWNAFARWILDKRDTSRKTLDIHFSLSIRQEHVEYFAWLRRRPEFRVCCRKPAGPSHHLESLYVTNRHGQYLTRTSAAHVAPHASAVNAMCRAGAAHPPFFAQRRAADRSAWPSIKDNAVERGNL